MFDSYQAQPWVDDHPIILTTGSGLHYKMRDLPRSQFRRQTCFLRQAHSLRESSRDSSTFLELGDCMASSFPGHLHKVTSCRTLLQWLPVILSCVRCHTAAYHHLPQHLKLMEGHDPGPPMAHICNTHGWQIGTCFGVSCQWVWIILNCELHKPPGPHPNFGNS